MHRAHRFIVAIAVAIGGWCTPVPAGPHVDVVTGKHAPALEGYAATELKSFLERLYDADVRIGQAQSNDAAYVILLGSPATNPSVRTTMNDAWPALSDQGFLLRSLASDRPSTLVAGGGSPVATLWATYELVHRFGVRFLLSGDVFPPEPAPLRLANIDQRFEPTLRTRTWRTVNDFAIGPEAWGIAEHRRVLRQLAKLRFNRVMLSFWPWQPFVDYRFGGVQKQTAMLWFGYRYPVDGDTAAKSVFRQAKEFINPDFAGKTTYAEMTEAGVILARGIIDEARRLGMSTGVAISPLEFPKEFADALPGAKVLDSLERLVVGPGPQLPPDDPRLKKLVATKIRAYLETYPRIDALYLTLPEFPDWIEHSDASWRRLSARTGIGDDVSLDALIASGRDRNLIAAGDRGERSVRGNVAALEFLGSLLSDREWLGRAGNTTVKPVLTSLNPALFSLLDKIVPADADLLHFVDNTARRVAENAALLDAVAPAAARKSRLMLTLADDNVGVMPQITTGHVHTLLNELRRRNWAGFSTRYWMIGDLDPGVYYLSRAGFDASVTPERAYSDLITATCGDGVAERMLLAYRAIEQATDTIDRNDIGFAFPVPGMVMKHYGNAAATPDWWLKVRDLYNEAMTEAYRAHGRAHRNADGGRTVIRYLAKRCEFAVHYLTGIEALRNAARAKQRKDGEAEIEQLEIAMESIYNAIDAMGEVTRDSCDRGLIAVLNAYGYRPLQAELDARSAALQAKP